MKARDIWGILKETCIEWFDDKAPSLGAALAYYSIFSIAPLLIIAIAIAGFFFGDRAAQGQMFEEIRGILGDAAAKAMESMLANARNQKTGIISSMIGVVVLIFGATGVFGQLQDALNTIWKVAPKPGRGVKGIIQDRFLSFTMVLGVGILLLASLLVSAALTTLNEWTTSVAGGGFIWPSLNALLSFVLSTLMFILIFKVLPDAKIPWNDVWMGAIVTAVLFMVGKYLLGFYLTRSGVTSVYGAAGSLVVLLLWVYYTSLIVLFGAEFTQVYANWHGLHVEPADNAIPLNRQGGDRPRVIVPTH